MQSILITLNPLIQPLQFLRDALLHPLPNFISFIIIIIINPVSTISTVQICMSIDYLVVLLYCTSLSGYFWICIKVLDNCVNCFCIAPCIG